MIVATYAVGAALLAVWLDARRPAPSLTSAFVHAVAALVAVNLLVPALHALDVEQATSARLAGILMLVVLPSFTYGFFALCRPLRVLASIRRFAG